MRKIWRVLIIVVIVLFAIGAILSAIGVVAGSDASRISEILNFHIKLPQL